MDGMFDFSNLFGFGSNHSTPVKSASKQRRTPASPATRLVKKLDVTYLDKDVLAVGRPWENRTEKDARRNNIQDLSNFLEARFGHRGFLLLKLTDTNNRHDNTDFSQFNYQVLECDLESRTSFESLFLLCHAVSYWLDKYAPLEGKRRALAVFCTQGICASRLFFSVFLTFRGKFNNTFQALEYFYKVRLDSDKSAESILKKQQPSLRYWLEKTNVILNQDQETPLRANPLKLCMLLIENLPLTTATNVMERKLFAFLGPTDEELAAAVQPTVRIYSLGLNVRQLIYSSSSDTNSTIQWDAKEGKLIMRTEITVCGDIEIECVFAANTRRQLFRYCLHTGLFSGAGVYSISGNDVDSAFSEIDGDFKLDLVIQKSDGESIDCQSGLQSKDSFLTSKALPQVGLEALTKMHFYNADPSLAERLVERGCSQLEARFALQKTTNDYEGSLSFLKLLPSSPDCDDDRAASDAAEIVGSDKGTSASQKQSQDSKACSSPVAETDNAKSCATPGSPEVQHTSRGYSRGAAAGKPTAKRLFSSPLRHHNRRFLKNAASSPKNAQSPNAHMSPCSTSLVAKTDQAHEHLATPSATTSTTPKKISKVCTPQSETEEKKWRAIFADIEAECPKFAPSNQDAFVGPSTPDIDRLLQEAAEQCENTPPATTAAESPVVANGQKTGASSSDTPENQLLNQLPIVCTPPASPPDTAATTNHVSSEPMDSKSAQQVSEQKAKSAKTTPAAESQKENKQFDTTQIVQPQVQCQSADDSKLDPFRRMLKMGVPADAVKLKMTLAGLNPALVGIPCDTTNSKDCKAPPSTKSLHSERTSVGGPEYDKFRKMLKLGIPASAVALKIKIEGLDPGAIGLGGDTRPSRTPSPKTKTVRRKKFHWVTIPENQLKKDSIWTVGKGSFKVRKEGRRTSLGSIGSGCSSPGTGLISPSRLLQSDHDPDMKELEALFSQTDSGRKEAKKRVGKAKASVPQVRLLDAKRSQNVAIGLKKLKMESAVICKALVEFDGETLGPEQLEVMKSANMIPTREEEKKVESFRGNADKLGEAEQYFGKLVETLQGQAETRLNAMLFKATFEENVQEVSARLALVSQACSQVRENESLQKLLQVILLIGNKINSESRGHIQGFSVSSLHKLSETRSFDRKTTILDFVASFSSKRIPEVKDIDAELAIVTKAKRVQFCDVDNDCKALNLGYQTVLRAIRLAERAGNDAAENGLKALRTFSANAKQRMNKLEAEVAVTKQVSKDLLDFFCEDTKAMQIHVFFSHLNQFLASFASAMRAFRAQEKRAAQAKKRALLMSANKVDSSRRVSRAQSENASNKVDSSRRVSRAQSENASINANQQVQSFVSATPEKPKYNLPTGKVVDHKADSPRTVQKKKRLGNTKSLSETPNLSRFLKNM